MTPSDFPSSELIINPDGSIYHLKLLPEDISRDIIFVGDPGRVDMVAHHFDQIIVKKQKREFHTITGIKNKKKITVISTGIGPDNIDIVLNELDALVNIDFSTRKKKETHTSLNIIRFGTSGALRSSINVGDIVVSRKAIGLDNLMHYYHYTPSSSAQKLQGLAKQSLQKLDQITPYACEAGQSLVRLFEDFFLHGITVTAPGFYGPQGRSLLAKARSSTFLDDLLKIQHDGLEVTNLEMETSAIMGLSSILDHQAISLNVILANRATLQFSDNPKADVEHMIEEGLNILCP